MVEAKFYEQHGNKVKCLLCPFFCLLDEDQLSRCHTRMVNKGKLYTIAYGNPCAVHSDPVEKKPLYHFLPGSRAFSIATAGCNLSCLNCQNSEISALSPAQTHNAELMPEKAVSQCIHEHCSSIAYTYTDPVVFYEYAFDTAVIARQNGMRNIIVSAGYINETPLRELCKYTDAANIDLKCFDNKVYHSLNHASLEPVLRTLKILKECGVWLEITNLLIPEMTDHRDSISNMCKWMMDNGMKDVPLHFSRFFPSNRLACHYPTPAGTLVMAYDIAKKSGISYVYLGNFSDDRAQNTYCNNCGKILIERQAYTIAQNNIADSSCKICGTRVPGVWS